MPRWGTTLEYCEGGKKIKYKPCWDWAWGNVNDCKDNPPPGETVVGWQACGIGSSPGGKVSDQAAQACSARTKDFSCKWGQNCFAITSERVDSSCSSTDSTNYNTARQYCDGRKKIQYQMCTNWKNNDPRSCQTTSKRPTNIVGWQACGIGSSPGGKEPGHAAQACSARTRDFSCKWGQNCFAITKDNDATECDTTVFSGPYEACDGNDRIKFHSCDKWLGNDPNSCLTSTKKPANIVDWKKCALGSSPGGLVPGKAATSCPLPAGRGCAIGQECYAVVERIKDDARCVQSNPFNIFGNLQNLIREYIIYIGGVVVSSALCVFLTCLLLIIL